MYKLKLENCGSGCMSVFFLFSLLFSFHFQQGNANTSQLNYVYLHNVHCRLKMYNLSELYIEFIEIIVPAEK